jgi:hypothetical protein
VADRRGGAQHRTRLSRDGDLGAVNFPPVPHPGHEHADLGVAVVGCRAEGRAAQRVAAHGRLGAVGIEAPHIVGWRAGRQRRADQPRVEAQVTQPVGQFLPGTLDRRRRRYGHLRRACSPRAAWPAPRSPRTPRRTPSRRQDHRSARARGTRPRPRSTRTWPAGRRVPRSHSRGRAARDRAVPGDGRQSSGIGDRPAQEQEVARLLVEEDGRAVIRPRLRVHADEL